MDARYERGQLQRVALGPPEEGRTLLLYLPQNLPSGQRTPAVLAFHGFHSNPWYFARLVELTSYSERYGSVVALPFGTSPTVPSALCCPTSCDEACCAAGDKLDSLRPCMWNTGGSASHVPRVGRTDDVAMARAAVQLLTKSFCVDPTRVSALGFSMGGMMMHRLACEAPDVFNGVAAISGSFDLQPANCNLSVPVAWMHFCGTADKGCSATVNSTFQLFSRKLGCEEVPRPTYVSATTKCDAYSGCSGGTFVERCLLLGLGDEVPGHQRQVPVFVPQPASNVDAIKYAFDRFSTQVSAAIAVDAVGVNAQPDLQLHV